MERDCFLPFHFIFVFWYDWICCHSLICYVIFWFSHINHSLSLRVRAHSPTNTYGNETPNILNHLLIQRTAEECATMYNVRLCWYTDFEKKNERKNKFVAKLPSNECNFENIHYLCKITANFQCFNISLIWSRIFIEKIVDSTLSIWYPFRVEFVFLNLPLIESL